MYYAVIAVQLLTLCVMFFEILFVVNQNPSRTQTQLLIAISGCFLAVVGYTAEIFSTTVESALCSVAFSYIGKPMALLSSLMFLLDFCGYKLVKWVRLSASVMTMVIPTAVFTNKFHHLFYATVEFDRSHIFSPLTVTHGPLYYLYLISSIAYFLAIVYVTVKALIDARSKTEKQQIAYFFVLVFFIMGGYAFYLTGLSYSYDSTMLGYIACSVILLLLFYRFKLFDTLAYAKDAALENASNGLLLLDSHNRIAYKNSAASTLLDSGFSVDELANLRNGDSLVPKNDKYYGVIKRSITNNGKFVGNTVELLDLTESKNYSLQLEGEIQRRVDELSHVQRKVIASFSDIVEARDASTGSHSKKTINYVNSITEELRLMGVYDEELTNEFCTYLADAAPLHDIGKLTIPDSILLKPTKLTDEEYETIKTHTKAGEVIIEETMRGIENDTYISIVKDVALHHHEKWDGSGYPDGLSGTNIPLAARIVAVADVYDALISHRCYKEPLSEEKACSILRECSGKHFDPYVVQAFLNGYYKNRVAAKKS